MSKYIKPADRHAVTGQSVTIEATRIIVEQVVTAPAAVLARHPGKVNYLGKTKAAKAKSPAPSPTRRIERSVFAKGRYFGSSERVYAFVMLDEDTAPKGDAANDAKIA